MSPPPVRVLQFAYDGDADNPYLPSNYVTNTVVYTVTLAIPRPVKRSGGDSSEAAHALPPLQNVLNPGREVRMNVPGCAEGNWRWRSTKQMLSGPAFE